MPPRTLRHPAEAAQPFAIFEEPALRLPKGLGTTDELYQPTLPS